MGSGGYRSEGEGIVENGGLDGFGAGRKGEAEVGIDLKTITDADKGRDTLSVQIENTGGDLGKTIGLVEVVETDSAEDGGKVVEGGWLMVDSGW